jgi:hypothetical protein
MVAGKLVHPAKAHWLYLNYRKAIIYILMVVKVGSQ